MTTRDTANGDALRALLGTLQGEPQRLGEPAGAEARCIETHLSLVLLAGEHAYKFKKPLAFDFVDFSTLEKRRYYCEEELRLNRRLAPELYLEVLAIGGDAADPRPGASPAFEYCVKMRRFDQASELEAAMTRGDVPPEAFSQLAGSLADFHAGAAVAGGDSALGGLSALRRYCDENFATLGAGPDGAELGGMLAELARWTTAELDRLGPMIESRLADGHVRECHGDLHLSNMIWRDGGIVVFDCIEFNDELRWIDVLNDVAFLLMDLDDRGRPDLAQLFLNAYLAASGEYDGVALLPLFRAYRSMVRAKVAALSVDQAGTERERDAALGRFERHVRLAHRYAVPAGKPSLIIARGLSGSGKTHLSSALIPQARFLRLRSDVERKRLHGLDAGARTGSEVGGGLYAAGRTERTYAHLLAQSRTLLEAGHSTLVDATFLTRAQRAPFIALARAMACPIHILDCTAPEAVLRERVGERTARGTDTSEADTAVLAHQLGAVEPLDEAEAALAVPVDTSTAYDLAAIRCALELPAID
ncbi:bifunctional aminoglycoside phosphotransferase/ATP-binding protein [Algiphilus sp.]|uniref:bifunctional aminoglycoside phosphotransferase/ATP-binding protein n=1 Tax=Algiphilus sp. TaxID=1872431 RepID=UPI0025C1E084|nr:bifunctional aminoglycoside phosphotransferase/ATP-binding protein [Algiphilus sp.]MCK5770219.1 AAA family ATPase [Algiphilus sp.]